MEPTHIVIHCSGVDAGTVEGLRRFHKEDRGWADIGYHFVIHNGRAHVDDPTDPALDGLIAVGRDLDGDAATLEEGAHALGYNDRSIGVCLIGRRGSFTPRELRAAHGLVAALCIRHAIDPRHVIGHYETEHEQAKPTKHTDPARRRKTCPELDMDVFRRNVREASEIIIAADAA